MLAIKLFCCIGVLILLISRFKMHPFLAFMISSVMAALLLDLPLVKIPGALEKGIGDMLASLTILLVCGAMFGKIVAASGAAQRISSSIMKIAGYKYLPWAMMSIGFIIGVPLFYGVGFILMMPIIFSVVEQYKLPAVATGLPLLAALSVTHGFLPPHPSPSALVLQFGANMGITLLYGVMVAIPAIILAGPLFARFLKKIPSQPLASFIVPTMDEKQLPGVINSFFTALLPILLLSITTAIPLLFPAYDSSAVKFIGSPSIVLLISLLYAIFSLGIFQQKKMSWVLEQSTEAIKDVSPLLLIVAGSGALKQVLSETGVNQQLGSMLQGLKLNPLILGWAIAAFIRACVGSATVAGLTTAGIIQPLLIASGTSPELMVLSIGAGSLAFSHVNDSGFWMFKEYFNLTVKDTLKSWSVMETIIAVSGLAGVLILNIFI